MQRISAVLFFLFVSGIGLAQDTIVFNDGKVVTGRILEVSSREIRYKTTDNPEGPVYTTLRWNIKTVTYQNGKHEVFDAASERKKLFLSERMSRNLVFAEVGGCGIRGISLNYDYAFSRKASYAFTLRFGINPGFASNHHSYLVLPVTSSFLYGSDAALELGAGIVLANYIEHRWECPSCMANDVETTKFIPSGTLGFRYQKRDALAVRMVFTPLFLLKQVQYSSELFYGFQTRNQDVLLTLGLSAGYAF